MKDLTMSLARVKLSLGQPHRTLVVLEHFLQEVTWERWEDVSLEGREHAGAQTPWACLGSYSASFDGSMRG